MVVQSNQIVHESETQRQFVRLQMPAQIQMDNVRYNIKDLSSGGLGIKDLLPTSKKGKTLDIDLILPFVNFSLDINLKAEVVHVDKKTGVTGCRFTDVSQSQLSILNHVIKAFMAGDVVGGDEILSVVSRDNFVNVRKHGSNAEKTTGQKLKQYFIYGLIALATILLGFYIFNNMMNRIFLITSSNSQVQGAKIEMNSPISGIYKTSLPQGAATVKQGQQMGAIQNTVTMTAIPVISPCDCFIEDARVLENAYVAEGTALFTMIPKAGDINITSFISMEDAGRINLGTSALIRVSGTGMEMEGTVTDIRVSNKPANIGEPAQTIVTIKPSEKLSADQINRPAFVEFKL